MRCFLFCIFFITGLCLPKLILSQEPDIKDIVLLNSYHPTFKWTSDLTQGVVERLKTRDNYRVSIEYMDAKRFQSEEHLQAFKTYLLQKYHQIEVDGIICSDNNAFDFFLQYGGEIWGDVAMTFCGVNNIRDYQVDSSRYLGVEESIDMSQTIAIIRNLQPNLDTLIVISDNSLSGKIFMNQFYATVNTKYPNLTYATINAQTVQQLGAELKKFNPINKAIYLLSLYVPRQGITREMIHEAEFLRSNLDVPIYGNWDFLFGDFIVGGVTMGGYEQGRIAADRMDALLKGNPENISFLAPTPERTTFDYLQLEKYGLDLDALPDHSTLLNRPVSFFKRYYEELIIGLSVLSLLLATILILLRIIRMRNKAEKELLKSENRLGLAMEGASLGLWDIDFVKRDLFLSKQIYQLLGYENPSDFDFGINNWEVIFHPDDIAQLIEVFQMHSRHAIPSFRGEVRVKTAGNTFKWFSLNGKITEFENGRPARMIGVITNINFQKEFEDQLRLAKEKAEESDRLKSSFLANMSHEIRTPMNAILGFTDLIISGNIPGDEVAKFVKLIRNSGESLLNLINDIIDFSKIQSGQLELRPEKFDLNALVDNIKVAASTIIHHQNKPIDVVVKKGSPDEGFLIIADPFRLEQVLYNLVSNSIKFTAQGEIVISYRIIDAETLSFSVKDTGKGVAPEHHEVIFERFRQLEIPTTNNAGGTGLGLAITQSLLSLMGGKITVQSNLNEGATFTFTINYKPISLVSGIHF